MASTPHSADNSLKDVMYARCHVERLVAGRPPKTQRWNYCPTEMDATDGARLGYRPSYALDDQILQQTARHRTTAKQAPPLPRLHHATTPHRQYTNTTHQTHPTPPHQTTTNQHGRTRKQMGLVPLTPNTGAPPAGSSAWNRPPAA